MTHTDFRAALSAPQQGASAWLYQGQAEFDGQAWDTRLVATTDERLARFKAAPNEPIPLYRHAAQAVPVPVGERLPGEEDCDAKGRCWWWAPKDPECPLTGHDSWALYSGACIEDTHWLPHWALPLPQEAQP
jgi:hypothetical protein